MVLQPFNRPPRRLGGRNPMPAVWKKLLNYYEHIFFLNSSKRILFVIHFLRHGKLAALSLKGGTYKTRMHTTKKTERKKNSAGHVGKWDEDFLKDDSVISLHCTIKFKHNKLEQSEVRETSATACLTKLSSCFIGYILADLVPCFTAECHATCFSEQTLLLWHWADLGSARSLRLHTEEVPQSVNCVLNLNGEEVYCNLTIYKVWGE